jgi:hypothetical protein
MRHDHRTILLVAALAAAHILAVGCSDDAVETTSSTGGAGGAGGAMTTSMAVTTSSTGGMMDLPTTFTVEGTVVDENGAPIEGATVLQGGTSYDPPHFVTGADGTFSIEIASAGFGVPNVVAAKPDHRGTGVEFINVPTQPVELLLREAKAPDNPGYVFQDPGVGSDPNTKFCGHCHETFAAEFQTSKHAQATKDPLVQDLFAGVAPAYTDSGSCVAAGGEWKQGLVPGTASDVANKCYLGGGVLPDLNLSCGGVAESACDDPAIAALDAPTAFGACADCHAPGIDGVAGGRNLHDAVGFAYDYGVHCDVCHKVRDVDLTQPPGIGQRLILGRPSEVDPTPLNEHRPIYYGPLLDVPNSFMGGSYQPKFNEATFCAGCHEQKQPALIPGDTLNATRWPDGLPVHSTYSEWLAGPYNAAGTQCQFCHMPARSDVTNSIDVSTDDNQSITFGFKRPPEDNRRHLFLSPLFQEEPRLIDSALFVSVNLAVGGGDVDATVSVANIGCGHAIPTGEPMRSLVMLVQAQGAGCNQPLPPSGGMTVHDVAGYAARGVEGTDVSTAGVTMTWAAGALAATAGDVVRVVRPSGVFDDYAGVGFFANTALTPAEKGLEIDEPVGEATVVSAAAGQLQLDQTLTLLAGDIVYLGDVSPALSDEQSSPRLAGAAGYTFSKVLTDAGGQRGVAHYRAIDITSDNRIPPGDNALTSHSFTALGGCTSATVTATVLYRPIPTAMAAVRGWEAKDYIIATAQETIPRP